jgi:hypothetical protein
LFKLLPTYEIIPPPIKSGSAYYFVTDNGVHYEVRFGRKQNNILNTTIVFGVINEEYEGEEYSLTNKFEVFRVMSTIVAIVQQYMMLHPKINCYEFTGEPTDKELDKNGTIRLSLYNRYLKQVFDENWNMSMLENKTIVSKKGMKS